MPRTTVIVIDTDPAISTAGRRAWWDVAVPEVSDRAEVRAARAAYERDAPGMTIRIGINPIAWSNDDMRELGGETPLETCLAEARQAGYAGIELGHKFPREPEALRPVLERHDLALVSGWYSANLLQRSAAAEMIAMHPYLNCCEISAPGS